MAYNSEHSGSVIDAAISRAKAGGALDQKFNEMKMNYVREIESATAEGVRTIEDAAADNIPADYSALQAEAEALAYLRNVFRVADAAEYLAAWTDRDGRFLVGIRQDGSVHYGAGIPPQVRDAISAASAQTGALSDAINAVRGEISDESATRQAEDNRLYDAIGVVRGEISDESETRQTENNRLYDAIGVVRGEVSDESATRRTEDNKRGTFVDSPEFLLCYVDKDNRILFGIRRNGSFYFGGGLPDQIRSELTRMRLDLDGFSEHLPPISVTDSPEYLAAWVDKDNRMIFGIRKNGSFYFGAGLPDQIRSELTQMRVDLDSFGERLPPITITDSPEYLAAWVDSENRILFGIRKNGSFYFGGGLPEEIRSELTRMQTALDAFSFIAPSENPEYLYAIADADGRLLLNIDRDGKTSVQSFRAGRYEYTNDNLSDLETALKNHGFSAGTGDWSDRTSLHIPEPRLALINFSGIAAMPTDKVHEINAVMEFWDGAGNFFKKNVIMAAQGNSSLHYVKKNIKFDLCNDAWIGDDTFSLKIGDWVPQDGFHLKAYYTDFFRGMAVVSYKLADDIWRSRGIEKDRPWKKALIDFDAAANVNGFTDLSENPLDCGARNFPDGFPCIVYLNGDFYGIYSFQLKKDRDNMRQDKNAAEHIHLDGYITPGSILNGFISWDGNDENGNPLSYGGWEIRNPKKLYLMDGSKYDADDNPGELIDDTSPNYNASDKNHKRSAKVKKHLKSLSGIMPQIRTLHKSGGSGKADEIRALYETYFDVENQIDYLIFSDVSRNTDGFGKNWQWATYDGVKWYVCPYDLDMTMGVYWDGDRVLPPLTEHLGANDYYPSHYLPRYYLPELEARYRELRDAGIISVDNIMSHLLDWTSRIGEDFYELEWERWPDTPSNGQNVLNEAYWSLNTDANGNPISANDNSYDNAASYQVGDAVSYGVSDYMGYFSFTCTNACSGIPPVKEFRYRDSVWRVRRWLIRQISNLDALYHYSP